MADAAKTKIYKLVLQSSTGGKPSYQYFSQAALAIAAAELFNSANAAGVNVQIASFQADLSAVNLQEFMDAGGMIVGPVALK